LGEIAMRRFGRSLVGICSLRLFGVYAISPLAGTFPPPSRNALTRIKAGGVGHAKQSEKHKDFLQLKCSTREQRGSSGQGPGPAKIDCRSPV
jgi:hypothetical protein